MATALAQLITDARAGMLLVSYNDEAWITPRGEIIGRLALTRANTSGWNWRA
ncbi:MAG: hypothetical protein R2703_05650 [Micropruina glycogenica]